MVSFLILVVLSSVAISKELDGVTLNPVLAYWIPREVFSVTSPSNLTSLIFLMGPLLFFDH